MTNRQDQIDNIAKLMHECEPFIERCAEALVDNGIGDKDRFEIIQTGTSFVNKNARGKVYDINPIKYKEE